MRIMFMDESGDHSLEKIDSQYPVFCLAGVIVDENNYKKVNDCINSLKQDIFNDTNVILHSRSIRLAIDEFNVLLNPNTRVRFYEKMEEFFATNDFTILASVILKEKLKNQYNDPSNPYSISMMFLMERYLYYLEENDDQGYITVESRDMKSNADLLDVYTHIMENGTHSDRHEVNPLRYQKRITKIEFVTKKQNENGHQIADLVAYPIATKILYSNRENPAYAVLKSKIRKKNGKIIGCGLKIFP